ncbi:hypothetical protein BZ17_3154 [Yersinia pseudotuberculosis IP 32953]|nr:MULTISPECIES: hypothetical protein [Yersinia pseudotuberculosis complex]CQD58376.1 Uncharacterised protein [Yersinia intermedia]ABS49017.1 hypothetical protein YpsIP31758_0513 [Yersinia pseudotuberculosis IP 31758]AJJ00901.1 hypothetical protein BZ21_2771 [Yersinia pseudotuberculosis]AJJ57113.1 hypothetical protein BZ17_3154 [Yersinia pseudotuberculosis IP 32953]AJJ68411.1 hypothetical protein BZ16_2888 [Yersinia pseudotuberculosis PB1/+]
MDLLQKECIASVTLFDLRTSEGELMVYEGCIDYVLTHCTDQEIFRITGCGDKQELFFYKEELIKLIKLIERQEFLPEKYKNI